MNLYKFMAEPLEEGQVLSTTSPAWLHSTLDVDWYAVDIVESGGLDWSLVIDAKLSGGVDGLREICIFYDRKSDGTTDFSKCESGSSEILNVSLGDIDISMSPRDTFRISDDPDSHLEKSVVPSLLRS